MYKYIQYFISYCKSIKVQTKRKMCVRISIIQKHIPIGFRDYYLSMVAEEICVYICCVFYICLYPHVCRQFSQHWKKKHVFYFFPVSPHLNNRRKNTWNTSKSYTNFIIQLRFSMNDVTYLRYTWNFCAYSLYSYLKSTWYFSI